MGDRRRVTEGTQVRSISGYKYLKCAEEEEGERTETLCSSSGRTFLVYACWFRLPGIKYGWGREALPATLPHHDQLLNVHLSPMAAFCTGHTNLYQSFFRITTAPVVPKKIEATVEQRWVSVCCERGTRQFEQDDECVRLVFVQSWVGYKRL